MKIPGIFLSRDKVIDFLKTLNKLYLIIQIQQQHIGTIITKIIDLFLSCHIL